MTAPTNKIIPIPAVREALDGCLWHEIVFAHGTYCGERNFFHYEAQPYVNTNVINGCMSVGNAFRIKRISLVPARTSLITDVDTLISNSYFRFSSPCRDYYTGQAQQFFKSSKDLGGVFKAISKLSKKEQKEVLQNIKTPNGFELTIPFHLEELECFGARFTTPQPVTLKQDVRLTCLLEGTLIRPLLS